MNVSILMRIKMKHLFIIIALLFSAGAISCKNRPHQTVFLLHFDNAVRDVGPHRHTLTVANVSVSSTQSVFGGKSGYFGEEPTVTIADDAAVKIQAFVISDDPVFHVASATVPGTNMKAVADTEATLTEGKQDVNSALAGGNALISRAQSQDDIKRYSKGRY